MPSLEQVMNTCLAGKGVMSPENFSRLLLLEHTLGVENVNNTTTNNYIILQQQLIIHIIIIYSMFVFFGHV